MKYRKLRITWSVACGILCLLLIALGVRSYWRVDLVNVQLPRFNGVQITSAVGRIGGASTRGTGRPWGRTTVEVWQFPALAKEMSAKPHLAITGAGGGYYTLWVSYCAVYFLFIGFGIAPWMRWPKRFSLRTLLIAMTLVAALVGLAIWAARR
jgi:hypothetical protein